MSAVVQVWQEGVDAKGEVMVVKLVFKLHFHNNIMSRICSKSGKFKFSNPYFQDEAMLSHEAI